MLKGAMNLLSTVLAWVRLCCESSALSARWDAPKSAPSPNNFLRARTHLDTATASLSRLAGARVLFLADDENLRYSARDWGYCVSFDGLRQRFEHAKVVGEFHAFFSNVPTDRRRVDYFIGRGWHAHVTPIEKIQTYEGSRTRANSDNRILYKAASLIRSFQPDVVVIGSGDGDLTCDLARMIREEPQAPLVLTVSVPGSASSRLNAAKNPHIWGNIMLGTDLLRPLNADRRHFSHNCSAKQIQKQPTAALRGRSHNKPHASPSQTMRNESKSTTFDKARRSTPPKSGKNAPLSGRVQRGKTSREASTET